MIYQPKFAGVPKPKTSFGVDSDTTVTVMVANAQRAKNTVRIL